jgi:hypothetical protein
VGVEQAAAITRHEPMRAVEPHHHDVRRVS